MHINYPGLIIEILKDLEKEKGFIAACQPVAFYIKHIDGVIKELREKLEAIV